MNSTERRVLLARLHAQCVREPRRTAEFFTIVRAYHIDEYGRSVGVVPNLQYQAPSVSSSAHVARCTRSSNERRPPQ